MFAVLNKTRRLSKITVNKFEEVLINIAEFADKFCTIVQGQKKKKFSGIRTDRLYYCPQLQN